MIKVFAFVFVLFAGAASWAVPVQTDEIVALRELADSLHRVGRTDSAAVVIEEAMRMADKSGDALMQVGMCSSRGVFLRSLGRVDEALQSYERALELITGESFLNDPDQEAIEEIASLYINLAVLNLDMQQKEKAAQNAGQSGMWIARSNDAQLKSIVYGVAGSVLTGCGQLQKAMEYQHEAYRYALETDDHEAACRERFGSGHPRQWNLQGRRQEGAGTGIHTSASCCCERNVDG